MSATESVFADLVLSSTLLFSNSAQGKISNILITGVFGSGAFLKFYNAARLENITFKNSTVRLVESQGEVLIKGLEVENTTEEIVRIIGNANIGIVDARIKIF